MRHNLRVFVQRQTTMTQKLIGKKEQALTENLPHETVTKQKTVQVGTESRDVSDPERFPARTD